VELHKKLRASAHLDLTKLLELVKVRIEDTARLDSVAALLTSEACQQWQSSELFNAARATILGLHLGDLANAQFGDEEDVWDNDEFESKMKQTFDTFARKEMVKRILANLKPKAKQPPDARMKKNIVKACMWLRNLEDHELLPLVAHPPHLNDLFSKRAFSEMKMLTTPFSRQEWLENIVRPAHKHYTEEQAEKANQRFHDQEKRNETVTAGKRKKNEREQEEGEKTKKQDIGEDRGTVARKSEKSGERQLTEGSKGGRGNQKGGAKGMPQAYPDQKGRSHNKVQYSSDNLATNNNTKDQAQHFTQKPKTVKGAQDPYQEDVKIGKAASREVKEAKQAIDDKPNEGEKRQSRVLKKSHPDTITFLVDVHTCRGEACKGSDVLVAYPLGCSTCPKLGIFPYRFHPQFCQKCFTAHHTMHK